MVSVVGLLSCLETGVNSSLIGSAVGMLEGVAVPIADDAPHSRKANVHAGDGQFVGSHPVQGAPPHGGRRGPVDIEDDRPFGISELPGLDMNNVAPDQEAFAAAFDEIAGVPGRVPGQRNGCNPGGNLVPGPQQRRAPPCRGPATRPLS